MPVIDLGSVVGPQGPQGAAGATGAQGIQGNPGPNQVTDQTSTNLNGVLFGSQSRVAVKPVDSAPTADSTNLVSSGGVKTALDTKANQAQLAYVENGTTASKDYLWNEFFWMGGTLYRTTIRVNNGTPFTVGTNCEPMPDGGLNKMAMRLLGATVGAETIQPPFYQCLVLATRNTGAYLGLLYTITATTWYLISIHNGISDISLNTSTGAITFPSYTQYVYFW